MRLYSVLMCEFAVIGSELFHGKINQKTIIHQYLKVKKDAGVDKFINSYRRVLTNSVLHVIMYRQACQKKKLCYLCAVLSGWQIPHII